ncbi:GTPase HflX [Oceanomicrobium pacificus]|uniref:GTPase HflX n=1 Tax=Oceanomicrobium pacificus TaxID=2692916 RepID=A0A6B0TW19_9RHOB|nr:GTPase HflX [Oceanomicrobium pacificus]MXU65758.1 GTPase HflX [Oceanomicrobium pacificus]
MRVAVLHPDIPRSGRIRAADLALEEARSLTEALPDLEVVHAAVVPVPKVRSGMLFGTGKTEELKSLFKALDVGLVIVDGPLTPIQQRNLEKEWHVKILDRTGLILEIFGERAATREGVLQVDLAHLTYQKSRLVRSWTHLERQRGGLGFIGGPGETQIEADRRALNDQILRIKAQLKKVVNTRKLHREARKKIPYPIVALVGYTNAGKSTIFNRLTGASVLAKDMLFATLDPTMRAVTLGSGKEVILSDTVGFVSDLPTQLVAAFRATLEEVLDADLIIHVRDISHPESEEQAQDVRTILSTLGVGADVQDRMVEVWNKIDAVPEDRADAIRQAASRDPRKVAMSALSGEGMDAFFEAVEIGLSEPKSVARLPLGHGDGKARAWLYGQKVVQDERQEDGGPVLDVEWTEKQKNQYKSLFGKGK